MSIKIDWSKFRKKDSDKAKTTLVHEDGHILTLAHNGLTRETKKQLEKLKMAEGGEVSSDKKPKKDSGPYIDPKAAKEVESGANESGWQPEKWKKNVKEGLGLAEGGEVDNEASLDVEPNPSEDQPGETIPVGQLPQIPQPGTLVSDSRTLPQAPAENAQAMTAPEEAQMQAPAAPQPQDMDPNAPTLDNAYKASSNAINKEADTLSQLGKEQAAIQKKAAEADQAFMATRQADLQKMQQETLAQAHDIANSKIDPEAYWKDHSKVLTAIGLFLGGFGGGSNPAMEYLNKAIERNVDAQKAEIGKKNNLFAMNMRIYGNKMAAEDATKAANAAYVAHQLGEAAAKASSPLAKSRALQGQAALMQQYAPLIQKAALSKTIASGAADHMDPAHFVNTLVKPDQQKQVFSEIEAAQNTKKMSKDIIQSFEDAAKENTVMKTGAGFLRTPGSVMALHQAMQPTFKDLEGTVRQAAMDNTFKNVTPMPGDSEHKIQQKREALMGYLQSKASAPTAKGNGLDLSKFESTRPITMDQQAMKTPEIKTLNGVQYQKVNGGWRKVQ